MATVTLDANEAVASVAYRTNEVIVIYPITPASPMGESCDEWRRPAPQPLERRSRRDRSFAEALSSLPDPDDFTLARTSTSTKCAGSRKRWLGDALSAGRDQPAPLSPRPTLSRGAGPPARRRTFVRTSLSDKEVLGGVLDAYLGEVLSQTPRRRKPSVPALKLLSREDAEEALRSLGDPHAMSETAITQHCCRGYFRKVGHPRPLPSHSPGEGERRPELSHLDRRDSIDFREPDLRGGQGWKVEQQTQNRRRVPLPELPPDPSENASRNHHLLGSRREESSRLRPPTCPSSYASRSKS